MQNLVRSYAANAPLIEKFILTSLGRVSLKTFNVQLAERLYKTFPSLELVYKCDEDLSKIHRMFTSTEKRGITQGLIARIWSMK
jgi:hypothetical protein